MRGLCAIIALGVLIVGCSSSTTVSEQPSGGGAGAAGGGNSDGGTTGGSPPTGGAAGAEPRTGGSGNEGGTATGGSGTAGDGAGVGGSGANDSGGGAGRGGTSGGGSGGGGSGGGGTSGGGTSGGGSGGGGTSGGGTGGGGTGGAPAACENASDCDPGPCQTADCVDGQCEYTLRAVGATCDDGSGCFTNGTCRANGACQGTPLLSCDDPPEPVCVSGERIRVFEPAGACTGGQCAYESIEYACPSCPECLAGCVIDIDGDGAVDSLNPGATDPNDGCLVCNPALSRAHFSPFVCEQEAPFDPCRELSGICDPAREPDCAGPECCEYAPLWAGAPDPQPSCPAAGEDTGEDGVLSNGESWSFVCTVTGACAGCTDPSQCDDGNACSDDSCSEEGTCVYDGDGPAGRACTVMSSDDGVCLTGGRCRLDVGEACSAGAECATDICECASDNCSASVCAEAACATCRYAPTGTTCSGSIGTVSAAEDATGCSGDRRCRAGACKLDNGTQCAQDGDCLSGNCECANAGCTDRMCAAVACAACRYTLDGTACTGALTNGTTCSDGNTCTLGETCTTGACGGGRTPEYCFTGVAGNPPCGDNTDNDGNGLTDCADPDCDNRLHESDSCCECNCGDDYTYCCC